MITDKAYKYFAGYLCTKQLSNKNTALTFALSCSLLHYYQTWATIVPV